MRYPICLIRSPNKIEMGLFRKTLWWDLLFNGRIIDSKEFYTSRNTTHLDRKGQRENKMKASCWTLKILQAGNRLIKLSSCKHMLPLMKKKRWLRRWSLRLRWWNHGPRGWNWGPQKIISRLWNPVEFAWMEFYILGDQWLFFLFISSLFKPEYLCQSYLLWGKWGELRGRVWKNITCFFSFTGPYGEELCSRIDSTVSHPYFYWWFR